MKHSEIFKSSIPFAIFLTVVALYLASCTTQTEDSKKIAENRNKEALETRAEEKDAQFLVEVAEINLEEIQLGQLAQSKSTKKEVKDLAKMMEDGHSKSLDQLKELASRKGIIIPTTSTKDVKEAYDKLSNKGEGDFNEDYCDMMVKGQKEAIDKVEKAATESADEEIKAWAANALPDLKKHLDHAMTCQGNIKSESGIGK